MAVQRHSGVRLIALMMVLGNTVALNAEPDRERVVKVDSKSQSNAVTQRTSRRARVACVGDSITQGDLKATGPEHSLPYPAHLQEILGATYEVANFGLGGTTLLNKGDRPYQKEDVFRRAKEFKPDIVVIMLGTNDTKQQNWKFKDNFAADYRELASRFTALDSKPRVFLCHPCCVVNEGNFGISEDRIQAERPIIDEVARQLHLDIIDVHEATRQHSQLFPDRVHPNDRGAELIATTIANAIAPKASNSSGVSPKSTRTGETRP